MIFSATPTFFFLLKLFLNVETLNYFGISLLKCWNIKFKVVGTLKNKIKALNCLKTII